MCTIYKYSYLEYCKHLSKIGQNERHMVVILFLSMRSKDCDGKYIPLPVDFIRCIFERK